MSKRIAIIQGHPDTSMTHLCHALVEGYVEGAQQKGHPFKVINVAQFQFPLLRSKAEQEESIPPEPIRQAQEIVLWANHLLVVFPLWLGDMPALLKGFFEQVLRPGFAFERASSTGWPQGKLMGRSARIVVTMGMPAFIYRWYYWSHGVQNLKRNILHFCGIKPVAETFIDMVESGKLRNVRSINSMRYLGGKGK